MLHRCARGPRLRSASRACRAVPSGGVSRRFPTVVLEKLGGPNAPRPGGPGRRPRSRRGTRACARGGHRLRAGDDATWDVSVSAAAALRARRRDRGEDGQTTRRRSGVPRAMPKLELEADNRRPTIAAPHSSRLGEPSRPAAVPRTRRAWVSADRDRSGGDRRQMEPDCRSQAVRNQDGRD